MAELFTLDEAAAIAEIERETVRTALEKREVTPSRKIKTGKVVRYRFSEGGTRIPLEHAASLFRKEVPQEEIAEDFRSLGATELEYARLAARFGAPPGRPKKRLRIERLGSKGFACRLTKISHRRWSLDWVSTMCMPYLFLTWVCPAERTARSGTMRWRMTSA